MIKFRQWISRFKRWHEWGFLAEGHFVGPENVTDPVMQSTGLCDKNGKELYEGDVIKRPVPLTPWNSREFGLMKESKEVALIRWDSEALAFDEQFRPHLKLHPLFECVRLCDVDFEILGNIYEHPHLLEGRPQGREGTP